MNPKRVIILDASVLAHKAIFSYGMMIRLKNQGKLNTSFILKPDYTYFKMIISIFKRIAITPEDTIICALDGRRSWRKVFLNAYKGNREANRNAFPEIDWMEEYQRIQAINDRLESSTDWHFLQFNDAISMFDLCNTSQGIKYEINNGTYELESTFGFEADDICAVVSKYYSETNTEVVIITIDKDLDMLCYYPNVKIFSLTIKHAGKKGFYKPNIQPLKILADKIRKGDAGDNILVSKDDTSRDSQIRELIINLISLPDFIETPILERVKNLPNKKVNYSSLPFTNSLGKPENFETIYSPDNKVTWEQSLKVHEKKKIKKSKPKVKV